MKKITVLAAGIAALVVSSQAHAQGDFIYYGTSGEKFDRNIEAAAIRKAAEKIGDLRGTIEGLDATPIITIQDLGRDQSSHLGLPVIDLEGPAHRVVAPGSIPLV